MSEESTAVPAAQWDATRHLRDLTRSLMSAGTVGEVLDRVVSLTCRLIPGADLVSFTLRTTDGRYHTPTESDPLALELDRVQYEAGEGPCVDAADESGLGYVRAVDLASGQDWPRFGPAAAAAGFSEVLATALVLDGDLADCSGALNIYSRTPGALAGEAVDMALVLATHASLAIQGARAAERAALRETQLRQAVESRDVIGQAKGILMQRRNISADDAFALLRDTSQRMNVKLAQLARTVTESVPG
ncbi:GAF and ANTAR domain-containing protein [Actinokineospora bangkokensis]|uniref:ANTAR domain-containing protein n=1 Tax=Actinokineospora bangkokensis TaxID=1193682 RepID=A0A1Q9LKI0_9PSEU|nr:GAF and ANTAR domain-containing protein [Actinokineospora bangkokensis]OLR92489.1 hypothetical protein BJP25_20680 [Actinokineospora bangkokensis]